MSAELAPTALSVARARRLTEQLRAALDLSLDLLAQVFEGRAWEVLGHPTWEVYCATELPQLAQLRLPLQERRATVATLRARGMSTRAIAAPLGLSVGTVHADLKAAGVQLATVTSLDGRQRPAVVQAAALAATPPARVANTDRTVELVRAAGEQGLTVRELCRRTGWHHGQASGTLSRLARQRRVVATATFRRACAAYVVTAAD